jgi:hypothetical protein
LLAAAVNKDGKMVVVLAIPTDTGGAGDGLLYSSRALNLPPIHSPIEEAPTRSIAPTDTPATPSPEPSLTPAAVVPRLNSGPAGLQSPMDRLIASDPLTQFAVAFLPVVLLLLLVLGWSLRAVRVKAE